MRLINIDTLELREFIGLDIPLYVCLSHRWAGGDEPTFEEFDAWKRLNIPLRQSLGRQKIEELCKLLQQRRRTARLPSGRRNFRDFSVDWCWVDTVCIDKRSSAELSEAINSMAMWYQKCLYCVAYLADVYSPDELGNSEWFQRGWTLQELLFPIDVHFFNVLWSPLGEKRDGSFKRQLSEITGIDAMCLIVSERTLQRSAACKMSWAAGRQTTRPEDMAYCLLGIFRINMPLLYGEGRSRAFQRLQAAIILQSDDETIFAWSTFEALGTSQSFQTDRRISPLAEDPRWFKDCGGIERANLHPRQPFALTNRGLQFTATSLAANIEMRSPDLYSPNTTLPVRVLELNCCVFISHQFRRTGGVAPQKSLRPCLMILAHQSGGAWKRIAVDAEEEERIFQDLVYLERGVHSVQKHAETTFYISLSPDRDNDPLSVLPTSQIVMTLEDSARPMLRAVKSYSELELVRDGAAREIHEQTAEPDHRERNGMLENEATTIVEGDPARVDREEELFELPG